MFAPTRNRAFAMSRKHRILQPLSQDFHPFLMTAKVIPEARSFVETFQA
jgi:hypothetical protein